MTNRNKHNDGKEGQNVKGRKGNIPLREFDNKRDVYWNKVADDWVEKNKEKGTDHHRCLQRVLSHRDAVC